MTEPNDSGSLELELGHDLSGSPVTVRPACRALLHTAIVAQSGAGKSTFLSRLLEEVLVSRIARVVVLDANGDFRRFAQVRNELSGTEFGVRWSALEVSSLNQGKQLVSWWDLDIYDQGWLLGIDGLTHPVELRLISATREWWFGDANDHAITSPGVPNWLSVFHRSLRAAAEKLKTDRVPSDAVDIALDRVQQATGRLCRWSIWAKRKEDVTLPPQLTDPGLDAVIVDLQSLTYPDEQKALASVCLTRLWEDAVQQRLGRPTVVVLDEAHNFAPADVLDSITGRSSAMIQRIAAEGRKYGLFLVLATQRPSKLRAGVLSECENVCIMRLQSPIEHRLAADTWGLPIEEVTCTRGMGTGCGLLAGRWVGSPVFFHGADRRTMESERD